MLTCHTLSASSTSPTLTRSLAFTGLWTSLVQTPREDRPGAAARSAEMRKVREYRAAIDATPAARLRPVALESHGAFGEEAVQFVQEMAQQRLSSLCLSSGDAYFAPRQREYLMQRLAVALFRAQAAAIRRHTVITVRAEDSTFHEDRSTAHAALSRRGDATLGLADLCSLLPPVDV